MITHASLVHCLQRFRDTLFSSGKEYISRCTLSFIQSRHFATRAAQSKEEYNRRTQLLPLAGYMSQYWGYHLEAVPKMNDDISFVLHHNLRLESLSRMLHDPHYGILYPFNFNILHFGIYFGLSDVVRRAIDENSQIVNTTDSWGRTPLHIACQRTALDYQCSEVTPQRTEYDDEYHYNPFSTENYNPDDEPSPDASFNIFRMLLDSNTPNATTDRQHRTPLHYGSMRGLTRVSILLADSLGHNEADNPDDDGRTPPNYAGSSGNLEVVQHLPLQKNINRNGHALWLAPSNGHLPVVIFLLQHGYDTHNEKAQLEAARTGHIDIVGILYEQGATTTYRDDAGMTALHHAAYASHTAVAEYLVSEGADINAVDSKGQSPLSLACIAGNMKIIKLLVTMGCNFNKTDSDSRTAFHRAAENGHADVLQCLLDHGARSDSSDDLSSCSRIQPDSSPSPPHDAHLNSLQISCKIGFERSVSILLEESLRPDKPPPGSSSTRSPLSYACENGHVAIVGMIIATGRVNVNLADQSGRTPLSWAAGGGHMEVVKLLLDQPRIEPGIPDNQGRTPLSYAAQKGSTGVVVLLLHKVAPSATALEECDHVGMNPIDYAARGGHVGLERILVAWAKGGSKEDDSGNDGDDDYFAGYSSSSEGGRRSSLLPTEGTQSQFPRPWTAHSFGGGGGGGGDDTRERSSRSSVGGHRVPWQHSDHRVQSLDLS